MKAAVVYLLILCLILSGCNAFMDGSYEWEASHPIEVSPGNPQDISAEDYEGLVSALRKLVHTGAEQGTIFVGKYDKEALPADASKAAWYVKKTDPIAAYAAETIECQVGTSGSQAALAIKISYRHDKTEIRKIKRVTDNVQAQERIAAALTACEPGIVLLIEDFEPAFFDQMVTDYAMLWPQYVMELPQVSENIYPEEGDSRVVELKFTYQTSRDSLKSMQNYVQTLFSSAMGYISGDTTQTEKLSHLYGFLMSRFNDKVETAITPAYHLLRHGVGDSKAFATVYAAMCRQAGLEAQVVSGTCNGESRYWNIVLDDGVYYHVDILRCWEAEEFMQHSDEAMAGYVWDFAAYPVCGKIVEEIVE